MKAIAITLAVLMIAGVSYAGNGDLIVDGNLNVDKTNINNGSVTPGIQFGSGTGESGEGIASKRTEGDNQWGMDFYTGFTNRMCITRDGNVGIGTSNPLDSLHLSGYCFRITTHHNAEMQIGDPSWVSNRFDFKLLDSASNPKSVCFWGGDSTNGWKMGSFQVYAVSSMFNGNVGIGTGNFGTGGSSTLLLGNGSKPSNISNEAGLYTSNSQLRAFDSYGNDNLISPHALDAPDSLYDIQDGMPMVVKEIQYFLGYVRYTNQTRQARLAGMTDAEKQQIAPAGRTCVIQETFAEHEARTGEKLTQLVWEEEQAKIKEMKDAQRKSMIDARAQLSTQIAAKDNAVAAAKTESRGALQQESTDLKSKLDAIQIPTEYVIQPIPPRLQAALNAAGI